MLAEQLVAVAGHTADTIGFQPRREVIDHRIRRERRAGLANGIVTAVSPNAFEQALGMVRRGGTISLNGLPPGSFPLPIFDMVLNGITVRGSIVGTRLDLQEALEFAGAGKVSTRAT
jgi:alcohol dehydrogenase, propanol-preferring